MRISAFLKKKELKKEVALLNYFHEIRCDNHSILSVDMLTMEFDFYYDKKNVGEKFSSFLWQHLELDFNYWINTSIGSFRYQYKFKCREGNSFWLGIALNTSGKPEFKRCRIEFNPNKVGTDYTLASVLNVLFLLCKPPTIRKFDLAIDYPVARQNAFLLKDGRTYGEKRNSFSDRTQYLGQRDTHGFVKLYNKTRESNLDYLLTRLELTIDYEKTSWTNFKIIFPRAVIINDLQLTFSHLKLTETDRYILFTAIDNLDLLKMLGKDKRKKIECILAEYTQVLEISNKDYVQIINSLKYFVKCPDDNFVDNPFTGDKTILTDWDVGLEFPISSNIPLTADDKSVLEKLIKEREKNGS